MSDLCLLSARSEKNLQISGMVFSFDAPGAATYARKQLDTDGKANRTGPPVPYS